MRTSAALRLLLALLLLSPSLGAAPRFDLLALGVFGGGYEGNLTCFALRQPGQASYPILIDGGSIAQGVKQAHARRRADGRLPRGFRTVQDFYLGLDHVFLTHSHLDHLGGLMVLSPILFQGKKTLRIHTNPHTATTVRNHLFDGALWADMEDAGKMAIEVGELGRPVEAGGFRVTPLPLDHSVPGWGYLFEAPDGSAFIHLGDTGPTRAYLPRARELLRAGKLRGLSLECSFPSEQEKLSLATFHLTPKLLVEHLRELVDPEREGDQSPPTPDELRVLGEALQGVQVVVQHLKAEGEHQIRREIAHFRDQGLPLLIPEQGANLLF